MFATLIISKSQRIAHPSCKIRFQAELAQNPSKVWRKGFRPAHLQQRKVYRITWLCQLPALNLKRGQYSPHDCMPSLKPLPYVFKTNHGALLFLGLVVMFGRCCFFCI